MMMIRTDRLPDAITGGQKRRFAVRSQLVTVSGKKIRNIVIFDNHFDSLRLLLNSDLIPRRWNEVFYAVLTIVLVLAAGLVMFWSLL
jgi:ABC-type thiamine transport system ATPase subunit